MSRLNRQRSTYRISDEQAKELMEYTMSNCCLIWIDRGWWGNRKQSGKKVRDKVNLSQEEKDDLTISNSLVDKQAIRDVKTPLNQASAYIRRKSRPWIHDAIYWIEKSEKQEIDEQMKKFKEDLEAALDEFIPRYPALIEETRIKKPNLYEASNYPSPEALRERFRLVWGFEYIKSPNLEENGSGISIFSQEEIENEQKKWNDRIRSATEIGIKQVREAFTEMIVHMRNVLKDGKKKFKESTIEKPKEFLKSLEGFKVLGDEPFKKYAKDALDLLDGVYAEDLRDDDKYRKVIADAVDVIVDEFKELPTVELERAIDF